MEEDKKRREVIEKITKKTIDNTSSSVAPPCQCSANPLCCTAADILADLYEVNALAVMGFKSSLGKVPVTDLLDLLKTLDQFIENTQISLKLSCK